MKSIDRKFGFEIADDSENPISDAVKSGSLP